MPLPDVQPAARVFLRGESKSLAELSAKVAARAGSPPGVPVVFVSASPSLLVGAAAWLAQTRTDGLLLPTERLGPELTRRLLERGYRILDLETGEASAPARLAASRPGRVALLTSGTTGEPKIIEHTWDSLFTMSKLRDPSPANWLVTYQPGTYAWWQMVTMALFVPGQNLTVSEDRSPQGLLQAGLDGAATAISSTPTLWRMLFLTCPAEDIRRLRLRQITLGGEAIDQPILDRLREFFSTAAITHIYATSEAGAAIVVRDGKEGFPAAWLGQTGGDRPRLEIRDGLLWIQSPFASSGDWVCTGDRCEVRGDRVFILGRDEGGFINVGGAKAPAHEIEKVLLSHPDVLWARVSARKAPLMGELVAAEIVSQPGRGIPGEAELSTFCASRLPDYMTPRFWTFLDSIPVTSNLKSALPQVSSTGQLSTTDVR